MLSSRFAILIVVLTTGGLAGAPSLASADTSASVNWAGYVAHKSGVSFRSVAAKWKQPAAVCSTPYPTYSAAWVGLGGYSATSNALEQVGTELDCSATGVASSSAWYELVPAPSAKVSMTIRPGDSISARVTVIGKRVTLTLTDSTRRKSFSKTVNAPSVDVTSAEWIVEAPSGCFNDNLCRTLPLTDFRAVSFSGASAQTTSARSGSISSRLWQNTKITLQPDGRTYIVYGAAGQATPTALASGGSSFSVDYAQTTAPPGAPPFFTSLASTGRPARAVQPGGPRRRL